MTSSLTTEEHRLNNYTLLCSVFQIMIRMCVLRMFYRPCDVEKTADPSRVTAMAVTALRVQQKHSTQVKASLDVVGLQTADH